MRYYGKIHSKLPIFRVKSVKIYTGQKNLHGHVRGDRDKYQVWEVTGLREGLAAQSTEAAETTAVYEITTTNLFFVHFVIFTFILYFLMKIK